VAHNPYFILRFSTIARCNMKAIFYFGAILLGLFEIANVYFIMPLPGSQRMDSLPIAYFLYTNRWIFRIAFGLCALIGIVPAWRASKWITLVCLAATAFIAYAFNFVMSADKMFYQPHTLRVVPADQNKVALDKLVLGLEINGAAKAYPIQYLGYHHQVLDTVGGKPVMVTYCTVCRTGRVYAPEIDGKPAQFRLVGMDHFNAMFEDADTHSWWRQGTGEAVAGPLKGKTLPEIYASQTTLQQWLSLNPGSLIMQADTLFKEDYADLDTYDVGLGRGKLTGTDTISWKDKAWVVGIDQNQHARAYDWNRLKKERVIVDTLGGQRLLLVMSTDQKSCFVYECPAGDGMFALQNDTIVGGNFSWHLFGAPITPQTPALKPVQAYQEFWHSWRSFHSNTTQY
jgi:hypothetical protein